MTLARLDLIVLAVMYAPAYWTQALGPWHSLEQSHAPIIALIAAWLVWRARSVLQESAQPALQPGLVVLMAGLSLFVLGSLLASPLLTLASQLPVFAGIALTFGGRPWLRTLGFPLALLLFLLPLPGSLVDAATAPLKEGISRGAEELLHQAGYPVARSGVVLHLSQYRLLVDDACSGLYSMTFLVALGALFAHLVGVRSHLHRFLLLACSLPVALFANLMRVLLILLTTYHAGDSVGQGPIHDVTGVVMFVIALTTLFALDALLHRLLPVRAPIVTPDTIRQAPTFTSPATPVITPLRHALITLLMLAAAGLSVALERWIPSTPPEAATDLRAMVPERIGHWHVDSNAALVPVSANAALKAATAYTQTLERIYVDDSGGRIMLSIVHSRRQTDERWQMHRPEYCYTAQGFTVRTTADEWLITARGTLPLRRLQTERPGRSEAVSYWLTVGDEAALPGWSRKLAQLRQRLAGHEPDGMLVRISSLDPASPATHALHDRFITDLLANLPDGDARRLAGNLLPGEHHGSNL